MKKLTATLLCLSVWLTATSGAFAEQPTDFDETLTETSPLFSQNETRSTAVEQRGSLPYNLRAFQYGGESGADVTFPFMLDLGMNTVLVDTSPDDVPLYTTDMNKTGDDLSRILTAARMNSLNVILSLDVDLLIQGGDKKLSELDRLVSEIHRFTLKYQAEAIVLKNLDRSKRDDYAAYMRSGTAVGFDNWRVSREALFAKTAADVIRGTDNAFICGYYADKNGGEAAANLIDDGAFDFLLAESSGTTVDGSFEDNLSRFGEIAANGNLPLYQLVDNSKLGSSEQGWGGEDQLLRQLAVAKDNVSYRGVVFASTDSLLRNPMNTTDTLKRYFEETIDEQSLFTDLTMYSPKNLSFVTYEPVADFSGKFDPNFEVFFNDSKITLNKAGNFYFEKPLAIGKNRFTITHKGKTYNYNIERKIIALKELEPSIKEGASLTVDGGVKIQIQAIAYKGAKVTAKLGNKSVKLKEMAAALKDDDANTSYAYFTGSFTAPEGIAGLTQDLGTIEITGSYSGYSRTMTGASVTVNAKPEPPKTDIKAELYDQRTAGTSEVVGRIEPIKTASESVTFIRANTDLTRTFDAKTSGTVYNPQFGWVPPGSLDYLKSTVSGFFTSLSGRRYRDVDVSLIDGFGIGENALNFKEAGVLNGDVYFKLSLDTPVAFNAETGISGFFSEWGGDFNIGNFRTCDYVYITFDSVTSVTKIPNLSDNPLFSSGEWEQMTVDGVPKFRMKLKLRTAGKYYGNFASYNGSELTLTFKCLGSSLSGLTVVIDPGHGYGKEAGKLDPGAIGQVIEQETNLAIAKKLVTVLEQRGAKAVRLTTEQDFILTKSRPLLAREYGCDIFISIHANKIAGDDTVRGTEAYYYNPFAEPLAESVSANIAKYFTKNVYSDGANKNRGAKYDYWDVCLQPDFPSILVETGFVGNMEDAMALADPIHQTGIANAIADGFEEYLKG
ncbi:MAG: N-acetylmuramoyl-L-alanine amidase [Oscillospiraceae bacterium]|jgi:N-acetylmuramoyl-L-alanine amidase|nr:N-acetylmuramoyl-L-alanine amidase [Oscillospiraceae bacterium]